MFLTLVAWVVFVFSSLTLCGVLWDIRPTKRNIQNREIAKEIQKLVYGCVHHYDLRIVFVLILAWGVSGWYITP